MKQILLSISLFAIVVLANAQKSVELSNNAFTNGSLTVNITTNQGTLEGYSPSNVMAIWISDSNGNFVKTLLALVNSRQYDLYKWKAVTKGTYNVVDAITGATQNTYGHRTCTWDGTSSTKSVLMDGNYTVCIEFTDEAYQGPFTSYSFIKGPIESTLSPLNLTNFKDISIQWIPTNTAINEVKSGNLYSIYPNPTKSEVYVDGIDVRGIDIYSNSGKSIIKTKQQKINLSHLPNGIYLAHIITDKGVIVKKITKE
ncbi:MAG: DUF2271 domain-containing protein [Paludibacter sp.]